MQQVQYNKTCIILKRDLRIDWKFGDELILSISTEQCNNIASQNHEMDLQGDVNLKCLWNTSTTPLCRTPSTAFVKEAVE